MDIYIKMEIKARELEGRLLLGMFAAERGHTVLLGEQRPIVRENPDLPLGLYHDTCLYPDEGQTQLRRHLHKRGWLITSQDEEHGLLEPTYDNYAVKRYSLENMQLASRIFAWGQHDASCLQRVYPDQAARVEIVGSPRIDLNRPELTDFFRTRPKPELQLDRPYVLFANNFTRVIGTNRIDTFVRHMRSAGYFDGGDDDFEFLQYEEAAAQMDFLPHMVRAIRQVAKAHPDITVVVRPHPQETESSWRDLIGSVGNVLVSGHGDIGRWLRGALAVVQSGDTTAFEATVAGVPLIAFTPVQGEHAWAARFANQFGFNASSVPELLDVLSSLRDGSADHSRVLAVDRERLAERITIEEQRWSAEALVDSWEALDDGYPTSTVDELMRRTRWARADWRARELVRPAVGVGRQQVRRLRGERAEATPFLTAQKFPEIESAEVQGLIAGFQFSLGRFAGVRGHLIGPRLVALSSER